MRDLKTDATFEQGKIPLVVRGSLPRVFLDLGVFLEAGLLFCGSYLLTDAMLQPLDAGTFSVVGGGMFLGLATVLLFYLAWHGQVNHHAEDAILYYSQPVQTQSQKKWAAEKKEELLRPM